MTVRRKALTPHHHQDTDIIRNLPQGVYIYHAEDLQDDRSLRLVHSNPASGHILGLPEGAGVGHLIDEGFPQARHNQTPAHLLEVVRTGTAHDFGDLKYDHTRFLPTWINAAAFALPEQHVALVFTPITGRKLAEAELARGHAELQKKQALLAQVGQLAALGTMAGGIAHDFNNILFTLMGYVELVHSRLPADDANAAHLAAALEEARRGRDLARQLLIFSHPDTQEKAPVQLGAITTETLQLVRTTMPGTTELATDITVTPLWVSSSPAHIQHVVLNLCNNGLAAMRNTGGRLTVTLAALGPAAEPEGINGRLPPGNYAQLAVTDTGCGIAVEDHQRLFEPFFTTHGRGEGRGLELTVALGALQAAGGIIAVASERGKGATFTAYWPLLEHEAIQEAARPLATAPAPRPGSILVIDDEACVGHMLERLLSRRGHRVTAVTDFATALSCFGQNPHLFDLIMLDQVMPGMKGLDLAPQLHQIRPDIPILLCTGFDDRLTPAQLRAAGILQCIRKPLDAHTLWSIVAASMPATPASTGGDI